MSLALPIIGFTALYFMSKSKKESNQGGTTPTTITPDFVEAAKPGQPILKVDKIHKLLNKVDFSLNLDNQKIDLVHKWKGDKLTAGILGKYKVEALTLIEPDKKGKMDYGAVAIVLKDGNKIIRSKRVNVNDGKVYDIL